MLKTFSLSKWLIGLLTCAAMPNTAYLLWLKNGVNFIYGAHTQVVDQRVFAKPIEPAAITGVNMVSSGGQVMLPDCTVAVDIFVTVDSSIPANAEVINGHGKYIIPGLVDLRAHLKSPHDLLLYLATQVTSIRGLGGRQCLVFTTPLVVMA